MPFQHKKNPLCCLKHVVVLLAVEFSLDICILTSTYRSYAMASLDQVSHFCNRRKKKEETVFLKPASKRLMYATLLLYVCVYCTYMNARYVYQASLVFAETIFMYQIRNVKIYFLEVTLKELANVFLFYYNMILFQKFMISGFCTVVMIILYLPRHYYVFKLSLSQVKKQLDSWYKTHTSTFTIIY